MNKQTYECAECGRAMSSKRIDKYHYLESGLNNVYLIGIEEYVCGKCKLSEIVIPQPLQLHAIIAIALARKPNLLNGGEIRFMRNEIGMTARSFAEAIGISHVTLSRWENDQDKATLSHDKLIRFAFKCMMQHKINAIIENLEKQLSESNVIHFEKNKLDIETLPMKYFSIMSHKCTCENVSE